MNLLLCLITCGILILNRNDGGGNALPVVETLHETSLRSLRPPQSPPNPQFAHISPKSGTVSAIIRSYKSAVTRHANPLGFDFAWQTRFYDHIIRNDTSFHEISNYIINNPYQILIGCFTTSFILAWLILSAVIY